MIAPYYDSEDITIYHADCLELLPELEADALITDPPYGYNYSSGMQGKFKNTEIPNDDSTQVRDCVMELWKDQPAFIFGNLKSIPPGYRTAIVWDKGLAVGMGDLSIPFKPNWELIFVFGKGFIGTRDSGVLTGHTVVSWSSKGRRKHPNEKPVSLMKYLISKCPIDWIILDPFLGSGSTLVAARQLGRKAIGIEIDESYCEIAARRLQKTAVGDPTLVSKFFESPS
jgi:site-specific DNA-methyltransferase (adenine-specific)